MDGLAPAQSLFQLPLTSTPGRASPEASAVGDLLDELGLLRFGAALHQGDLRQRQFRPP